MTDVDLREASMADLVQRLSDQTATLVRQEMRLAQTEMQDKAKRAALGGGLMTGAGVVALGAFGALIAGLVLLIGEAVALWISAFIVTGLLLITAGAMALLGRQRVAASVPPKPDAAIESIKADVAEIKEAATR